VRFDAASRALYSTDASVYRQVPIGVVVAEEPDDVRAAIEVCRAHDVPVLPRGTGTSLAGQACNVAVVIDTSRLRQIVEIDADRRTARVQPGVVLDDLRAAAAPFGLTFGPDPSTHNRCTLGGMIGNNACGTHSIAWGKTVDNVDELDVLLYDGTELRAGAAGAGGFAALAGRPGRAGQVYAQLERLRLAHLELIRTGFPALPRRVSGYNLDELLPERGGNLARALVGTEGTCAVTLEAALRLVPAPAARVLLALGYPDIATAADQAPAVLKHRPIGLEGMSEALVHCIPAASASRVAARMLPEGGGWLLAEFGGGDRAEATARAEQALRDLRAGGAAGPAALVAEADRQRQLWSIREDGAGLASRPGGREAWSGWEDAAVPPERLGGYLRDFQRLLDQHRLHGIPYGHFGDGCVHVRIDFDLATKAGAAGYRGFLEEAADLVVGYGGSLSGEHGDGQARAELLGRMYSKPMLAAFGEFKSIFDPANRMNPGKVVDPNALDADLRPAAVRGIRPAGTFFALAEDGGDFTAAVRRCVGVGNCVRPSGGTMCPSYQVTGEEQHSTRGRSRLLFEMLAGDVVTGGWRATEVRDALDLCLACKACRTECPVSVDMATYKAEFLAQHYRGRPRPAAHYSMGYLPTWARAAARAPRAASVLAGMVSRSALLKEAAGIDRHRELPRFARESFQAWFRRQGGSPAGGGPEVLLWPDTFTNFFAPEIGRAAVRVLRAAGFRVRVPDRPVCCGLTWISTGQLGVARRVIGRTLRAVSPFLASGVPIVGLEPSCTAALRGDVPELVDTPEAHALAGRIQPVASFLAERAPGWQPPRLGGKAVVQVHCHQQAVLGGYGAEHELLQRSGVEAAVLGSGCCGLAGNFGFEKGHYDVSMACAEQALLPAIRAAEPGTPVICDGFSCRLQVEQSLGLRAKHLVEVLDEGGP
jgi:FAD/FMN-containing dehydrogenase/Fe-S oxidoreductase